MRLLHTLLFVTLASLQCSFRSIAALFIYVDNYSVLADVLAQPPPLHDGHPPAPQEGSAPPPPHVGGPTAPHERRPFPHNQPRVPHRFAPRQQLPASIARTALSEATDILKNMDASIATAPLAATDRLDESPVNLQDDNASMGSVAREAALHPSGDVEDVPSTDAQPTTQPAGVGLDLNISISDGVDAEAVNERVEQPATTSTIRPGNASHSTVGLVNASTDQDARPHTAWETPTGIANSSEGSSEDAATSTPEERSHNLSGQPLSTPAIDSDNVNESSSSAALLDETFQRPIDAELISASVDEVASQDNSQETLVLPPLATDEDEYITLEHTDGANHDEHTAMHAEVIGVETGHESDPPDADGFQHGLEAAEMVTLDMSNEEASEKEQMLSTTLQPHSVTNDVDGVNDDEMISVQLLSERTQGVTDSATLSALGHNQSAESHIHSEQPDAHEHASVHDDHGPNDASIERTTHNDPENDGYSPAEQPKQAEAPEERIELLRLPAWELFVPGWMNVPTDDGWRTFKVQTCLQLLYAHVVRVILAAIRAAEQLLLVHTTTYDKVRPHLQTVVDVLSLSWEGAVALIPSDWEPRCQQILSYIPEEMLEGVLAALVLLSVWGWVRMCVNACIYVCCCGCRRKSNFVDTRHHFKTDAQRRDPPTQTSTIASSLNVDPLASGFTEVAKVVKTGKITLQLKQLGHAGTQSSQPSSAASSPQGYPRNLSQLPPANQPFQVPTLTTQDPHTPFGYKAAEQDTGTLTSAEHGQTTASNSHQPPAAFAASAAFNTRAPRTDSRNRVLKTATSAFNAVSANGANSVDSHHLSHYAKPPSFEGSSLPVSFDHHNGPPSSRSADRHGINEYSPSGQHPPLFPPQDISMTAESHAHDSAGQHHASLPYTDGTHMLPSGFGPPQAQWQGHNPSGFPRRSDAF
jgi:hypothetical protein